MCAYMYTCIFIHSSTHQHKQNTIWERHVINMCLFQYAVSSSMRGYCGKSHLPTATASDSKVRLLRPKRRLELGSQVEMGDHLALSLARLLGPKYNWKNTIMFRASCLPYIDFYRFNFVWKCLVSWIVEKGTQWRPSKSHSFHDATLTKVDTVPFVDKMVNKPNN